MAAPFNASGSVANSFSSRMPAISTSASVSPEPAPSAKTMPSTKP
jgi:hypothetical protein